MKKFFWFCAGSTAKLLEKCPSDERAKHAGIGAMIFITASLAILSGTFAIQTIVESKVVSVLIGLFWGFVIFNIDRLMVSTMKKENSGDKLADKKKELIFAMPRIILAIIIAIVISKPIEVKLLEAQIETQSAFDTAISQSKLNNVNRAVSSVNIHANEKENAENEIEVLSQEQAQVRNTHEYKRLDKIYKDCEAELKRKKDTVIDYEVAWESVARQEKYIKEVTIYTVEGKDYKNQAEAETTGKNYTSRVQMEINEAGERRRSWLSSEIRKIKNSYPNCEKPKKVRDDYETDEISRIQILKENEKEQRQEARRRERQEQNRLDSLEEQNRGKVIKSKSNFFGKLMALKNATTKSSLPDSIILANLQMGPDNSLDLSKMTLLTKGERKMIKSISWALLVLFFVIELLPIFVKIMVPRGVYDEHLESEKTLLTQKIKRKDFNEIQDTRLKNEKKKSDVDADIQVNSNKNYNFVESESRKSENFTNKIITAREELEDEVIETWKRRETNELRTDPENYLKKILK